MSVDEAAASLGMVSAELEQYEAALEEPGALCIAEMAKVYGVGCSWLFGQSQEMAGCTHGFVESHLRYGKEGRHLPTGVTPLSPKTEEIIRLVVGLSKYGGLHEPVLSVEGISDRTGLRIADIIEAMAELEASGYIRTRETIQGSGASSLELLPEGSLFVVFDRAFTSRDPEADAKVIARMVCRAGNRAVHVPALAASLEWEPRRMNPALHFLIGRGLVACSKRLSNSPWVTHSLRRTSRTRPLV